MSCEVKPKSSITYQRRRRKRNRSQHDVVAGGNEEKASSSGHSLNRMQLTKNFYQDDQHRFSFLDKDGDGLADGKPQFRSLPILLEERRSGRWIHKQKRWQSEMLFNFTKKPAETYIGRRQWRPFAGRKIPFTRLGIPPSDAVLAVERNGDYILTLGNMDDTSSGLAFRFYGINSVASTRRRQKLRESQDAIESNHIGVQRAPLIQTTPLHCETKRLLGATDSAVDYEILDQRRDVSPATTPIELIVSKDWKVGVALLYPMKTDDTSQIESQGIRSSASMVLFTLPRRQSPHRIMETGDENDVRFIFHFCKIPKLFSDSRRKMLWLVESIPKVDKRSLSYLLTPGYLLVHDEGNGVRLTWATEKYFLSSSCKYEVSADNHFKASRRATDVEIVSHQQDNSWMETRCNSMGEPIMQDQKINKESLSPQVSIANESFLHLDVLLSEVLSRRKGITEKNPDFCSSLISVNRSGRIADFVIVFTRRKNECYENLGFFTKIDLFRGDFIELDWVRSKGKKDASSLRKWCNKLAVNRRMKDLRAGPFAVTDKYALDCTRICKETFAFDNDEEDDYDESYWREYAEGTKGSQAPKLVTFSSLYPSCDIITNQAIINFEPVMSIRAKDSPLQIVYT